MSVYQKYVKSCDDSSNIASLQDLFSPLMVLSVNLKKGFCLAVNNGNYSETLTQNFSVANTSDFTNLVLTYTNQTDVNNVSFLMPISGNESIPIRYDIALQTAGFTGYNVAFNL